MAKTLIIKGANFEANSLDTVQFDAVPCTELEISEQTAEISNTGTAVTLTATPTPADTTDTLTWESSDPTIVSVANGTLTPLGVGTVTITAKCGEQTATCTVTSRWFMDGADVNKVLANEASGTSAVDGGNGRPYLNSSNWYSVFCALTGQYSYWNENDKYPYPIPKGATKVKVSTNNSDVLLARGQWFNLATENPDDSGVCYLIGTSQSSAWTQSGTDYTINIPQYQDYPTIDGFAVSVVGDQNYMDQSRTDAVVIEFLAS